MEKVFVHELFVPKESEAEFLKGAHQSATFLRALPGFVEGFLYQKKDGESRYNFITVAVWENEEAFESAKATVALDYKQRGYDPQETAKRLRIEHAQSTFERSPY